jgi:hypothetical protein
MASKKKSAIQARQGHPTGIIDDTAKAFGRAKEAAKLYASATKSGEKFLANREARKQFTRKNFPDKGERTMYRDMVKRDIREEGGTYAYNSPLGTSKQQRARKARYRAAKKETAARRAENGEKWVKAVKPKPAKKTPPAPPKGTRVKPPSKADYTAPKKSVRREPGVMKFQDSKNYFENSKGYAKEIAKQRKKYK